MGYEVTKHFGLSVDIKVISLMVSFCVIFTISESFRRRERTLQDIAAFKSGVTTLYYTLCHLYSDDTVRHSQILSSCRGLFKCLTLYIYDRNVLVEQQLYSKSQQNAVQHFYGHINKLYAIVYRRDR